MGDIDELRRRIDVIDERLVALLNERSACALEIGRIKNDQGETQSGYFLRFNRNKRSVTLNLKTEEGRRLFGELAEKSDVVVENFRPGLLDEMGIGYKALSERNPRLIYACISGFGSLDGFLGPYSKTD